MICDLLIFEQGILCGPLTKGLAKRINLRSIFFFRDVKSFFSFEVCVPSFRSESSCFTAFLCFEEVSIPFPSCYSEYPCSNPFSLRNTYGPRDLCTERVFIGHEAKIAGVKHT